MGQYNSAEVQQCRKIKFSSTVPKMKTLFNSAKNMNKFQLIKCGKQGYIAVFRQPRIQTRQYLDKYCFNHNQNRDKEEINK